MFCHCSSSLEVSLRRILAKGGNCIGHFYRCTQWEFKCGGDRTRVSTEPTTFAHNDLRQRFEPLAAVGGHWKAWTGTPCHSCGDIGHCLTKPQRRRLRTYWKTESWDTRIANLPPFNWKGTTRSVEIVLSRCAVPKWRQISGITTKSKCCGTLFPFRRTYILVSFNLDNFLPRSEQSRSFKHVENARSFANSRCHQFGRSRCGSSFDGTGIFWTSRNGIF